MKKHLLTVLLSCLAVISLRADIVYQDNFNYLDGQIIAVGTNGDGSTNWFHTGGATVNTDFFVFHHKAEISSSVGATVSRAEDVHCNFSTFTNAQTVMYASFTVNCTNLPPAVGTYFAHFYANSSGFHSRVFAQSAGTVVSNSWRLGISAGSGTVNRVFPVDLSSNTDYQVVIRWNPTINDDSLAATLWVNPITSSDLSLVTADTTTAIGTADAVGFGFRQASGFGNFFCTISNLACATTWDEAATNVWPTNAVSPVIVRSSLSQSNFVGDAVNLSAIANGQSLSSLTYQWQKDGVNVVNPNGNSNVFSIASAGIANTGNYRMIATTLYGLSATSTPGFLWVTNAPIAPTISPTNATAVTAYYHQTSTLQVTATGPAPITYQWYYANSPATGPNVSGADSDTLTISDVFTNNSTAGAYYAVATNPFGSKTSGVFTVTVAPPPSIAYLRTLVNPTTFAATNTSLRWQVTGTVTTFTNVTSADTSSYYLQDGTAGINIFVTRGHDFRPPQGTSVTFVGFLQTFNNTLELEADTNDVTTSFTINTNNDGSFITNTLPAPKVIPFGITNDIAYCEYTLEGSIVMLTNVYFGTNAGTVISALANTTILVTNAAGQVFPLLFSNQDQDVVGQTLPSFASSVVGVFTQNSTPYVVEVTRFADIVTNPPPQPVVTITRSANDSVLSWPNVPWDNVNFSYGSNYSYTIQTQPDAYEANLNGANEVPASGSTATGFGRVVVSPDGSSITVNMSFSGLTTPASAAHIHGPTGVGTNAGVLFPFSGVPSATSGSIPEQTFALSPTQAGYLYNGLLYMNVHDSTFPNGEIRDQLRPQASPVLGPYVVSSRFQTRMLGINEVPANGSTGTGFGTVVLSPDQTTITVNMSFSGLSAPATIAHIHGPAGVGTNASVLFPFSGVPAATSGSIPQQTFAITPTQVGYLQSGLLYMNVHNSIFPGGELRDQIRLVPASGLTFANTSFTNTSPTTATYTDPASTRGMKFYRVTSP